MANPFDMEVFLNGVLSGSHTTRRRHLRQAMTIQTAISNRWKRNNPWTWQQKHLAWFMDQELRDRAEPTRYYFWLTVQLIVLRLGKSWFGSKPSRREN
nr:hypothetical protein [Pseudomonas sp. Irchel 3A18]